MAGGGGADGPAGGSGSGECPLDRSWGENGREVEDGHPAVHFSSNGSVI